MSSTSGSMDRPRRRRGPSVVLKPYAGADRTLWRRLMSWSLVPGLALFCFIYGFFYAIFAPYLIVMFMIPLFIMGALAIWALPDMRQAPTRSMVFLYYALYITLVLWPNYLAFALPGMPWITIIRITGFPLAFMLLVSVSVSKNFRTTLSQALSAAPLLWKLLVAFTVIEVVSIVFSHNFGQSIQKLILAQISWTAIFFVCCYVFLKPGRVERWAALMWIMAVIVCLFGLWEHHLGHVPWRDHIPGFLKIGDPTVNAILAGGARTSTGMYRVQSTFGTSLNLAEYLALTLPFVLHFIMGDYKPWVRLAGVATIPLFLDIVVATDSRLGSVGFFLAFVAYPFFWSLLRWRRLKSSLVGPAIALSYPVLFCGAVAAVLSIHKLRSKIIGNGSQNASNEGRSSQFKEGIPKILKHPWGYGIGMGADALGNYTPSGVLTIDSYYLSVGLEYGVIGFILYYGMLAVGIQYSAKYALNVHKHDKEYSFLIPITIALTNFVIIKAVLSQQDNHPLIFMMLGMVVALIYRLRAEGAPAQSPEAAAEARPSLKLLPNLARLAR